MGLHVFPILIPPSHLPLHLLPLGFPSAPGPSACLMHPTAAQVWMHETSAQGWCTGMMIQRDGMGREVGGGFRMGNTCKSMADSCQCMAKTATIL